jgi:hypothetical protein
LARFLAIHTENFGDFSPIFPIYAYESSPLTSTPRLANFARPPSMAVKTNGFPSGAIA